MYHTPPCRSILLIYVVSIHFVTEEIDAGPIIVQEKGKVNSDRTIRNAPFHRPDTIAQK